MLENYIRPFYQYLLVDPVAKILSKHFSPIEITGFACALGCCIPIALMFGLTNIASLFLLGSGYLDTLDGTVARMLKQAGPSGTILDIVADRIVEFAIIVGLFMVDPLHRSFLSLLMLGSCYICVTSFLVVGIFINNQSDKGFHYSSGLIERAEAFIFFLLMIWLPAHFLALASLFSGLVLLTSFLRVKQFLQQKLTFNA